MGVIETEAREMQRVGAVIRNCGARLFWDMVEAMPSWLTSEQRPLRTYPTSREKLFSCHGLGGRH